jgi:xanthine phosphoribosyltransferase
VNALKQRIQSEGRNLGGGILQVTGFINHQIDAALMDQCGRELASRFAAHGITRVLTAETSGIAPGLATALHLKVPMVFARKVRPVTLPPNVLHTVARSHTKGRTMDLIVSPEYLRPQDRVLIVDDFLARGDTLLALAELVRQARAALAGIGVLIEKSFEEGRAVCAGLGVPVEALATVVDMTSGAIVVA